MGRFARAEGAARADVLPPHLHRVQRLSTVGHWAAPVQTRWGAVQILTFHATPPVFDGPEDRNGYRNADELRLWLRYLNGAFGPPPDRFVLLGDMNNDPQLGEGHKPPLLGLLTHPQLQDPFAGKAAATVAWKGLPAMRVDYALPSRAFEVVDLGVTATEASRHHLVWVDVKPP